MGGWLDMWTGEVYGNIVTWMLALWYKTSPSPSPIHQHRYAPHSTKLGLLKVLSTWLMGRQWATAMTGSQTVQLTGTNCGCT